MAYVLHKSWHYLANNNFVLYVDTWHWTTLSTKHNCWARLHNTWLLLSLEYDFTIIYKLEKTHLMVDAFFRIRHFLKPKGILDQMINILFLLCSYISYMKLWIAFSYVPFLKIAIWIIKSISLWWHCGYHDGWSSILSRVGHDNVSLFGFRDGNYCPH